MRNTFVNFKKLSNNIAQARNFLFHDGEETTGSEIKNLNRINVFVGQNNSGKSRLMRSLFIGFYSIKSEERLINTDHLGKEDFNKALNEVVAAEFNSTPSEHYKTYLTFAQAWFSKYETKNDSLNFTELDYLTGSENIINVKNEIRISIPGIQPNNPAIPFEGSLDKILPVVRRKSDKNLVEFAITYVPSLRNIRNLGESEDATTKHELLKIRTRKDYFSSLSGFGNYIEGNNLFQEIENDIIFSGENLYKNTKDLLLSYHEHRIVLANFESFLSDTFFNGEKVSLMPIESKGKVNRDLYVKIGDEKERPIYELGDGINYIIILTFPLFLYENERHYLFIEEPELHLHPGLQRVFMKCLERFTNTQVYITTHSNHILDMTLEMHDIMSVYTFHKKYDEEKKEAFTHVNHVSTSDQNILDLIGVRNSSVFLANCTIWVEGISDVLYIRKYLELYMQQKDDNDKHIRKQYLEGIHFAFIEYGGSNLVHWSFIENSDTEKEAELIPDFISNNRFLICDRDNTGKEDSDDEKTKKEKRYKEYEEKLKEKFHLTLGLEVENMIPFEALNSAIKELKNKDAVATSIDDYKKVRLGEFLLKKTNSGSTYWTKEGKLQNKAEFARRVIKHVSDLPEDEEAYFLAEKLYNFIALCNIN
jgi:predicted ATP-dependent endonuclease of OLD family